jgi:hypothetical protein
VGLHEVYNSPYSLNILILRSRQQAKEGRKSKIAQDEARQRHMAEKEHRRVKAETKAQLLEQYPRQSIGEEGLTTASVWNLTLKRLKEQVSVATYETWLKDTMLLHVTNPMCKFKN